MLGTVLSLLQLLIYAVLARQGTQSVYLVWVALVVRARRRLAGLDRPRPAAGGASPSTRVLFLALLLASACAACGDDRSPVA